MPTQPTQAQGNLKVIKVGQFRMFFILGSIAGLLFFGASQNLIVLPFALAVLFGWVIFELNVVFQAIMGVQRILLFAMQPKQEPQKLMEIEKPNVKLIDINSGVSVEDKSPRAGLDETKTPKNS